MEEGGKLSHLISLEFHHYVTGKWCCEVVVYDSERTCGLLTQSTCVCHQSVPRCQQQQQQFCVTVAAITRTAVVCFPVKPAAIHEPRRCTSVSFMTLITSLQNPYVMYSTSMCSNYSGEYPSQCED